MTDPMVFDPQALERQFEALDGLERGTWLPAIVNCHGRMGLRLPALVRLRARLIAGVAPFTPDDGWPDDGVAQAFGPVFGDLGIPSLCRGRAGLADEVIRSLLWHLDLLAALRASLGPAEALRRLAEGFRRDWVDQRADLEAVLAVFDSPQASEWSQEWSRMRGLLREQHWQSVLDAHRVVRQLPGLADVIGRLGRNRPAAAPTMSIAEPVEAPAGQARLEALETQDETIAAAGQPEAVGRGGDLSGIVASEAACWLVSRPGGPARQPALAARAGRLRRMFQARLAEQALLCYERRQPLSEPLPRPSATPDTASRRIEAPRPVAGPMIICIDTSSSMTGAPERVARAVVLEAMRTAIREGRSCFLIAFSGPGEIREIELRGCVEGIDRLARFLSGSFHGGTDFAQALERSLALVERGPWTRADLLLATDGEFGVDGGILSRLQVAREEQGLRVQAVLIADRETIGLREVVDAVFWIRDWRRFDDRRGQTGPAVHDSRLTALFFPDASMRAPRDGA
jgi:Mg-chelatase subunit ChlD